MSEWNSLKLYRHKKTGRIYNIYAVVNNRTDGFEGQPLVIYGSPAVMEAQFAKEESEFKASFEMVDRVILLKAPSSGE